MDASIIGIVVGGVDFGESDRIVHLLTHEGRFSGFAPAARKSRRRFGGSLEPFTTVRVELGRRRSNGLATLASAEPLRLRLALTHDLDGLTLAAYACELSLRLSPEGAPTELPSLLEAVLDEILEAGASIARRRAFELGVLQALGTRPRLDACPRCEHVGRFLDLVQGGLMCERHRNGAREIGPRTRAWIEAVLDSGGIDSLGPLSPPDAERAARAVGPSVDAALRQLVDGSLSSLALLSELGL